jgi:hypothetical protein
MARALCPERYSLPMLHRSKICYGRVMSLHNTSLNTRGYSTSEPVRINDFVVREDAVARDDQSVRALEEALAQRENALSEAPVTL